MKAPVSEYFRRFNTPSLQQYNNNNKINIIIVLLISWCQNQTLQHFKSWFKHSMMENLLKRNGNDYSLDGDNGDAEIPSNPASY